MQRFRSDAKAALFLLLLLCGGAATHAQDPSIQNWGSPPGHPPPYKTPDIWVEDSTGAVAEPLRGQVNRLFARIRNLSPVAATNISVRFAYAPYGLWSPASWGDFRSIPPDPVTVASLGPAGSGTDETTIEVPWDLTNLSDDNGGAWGGFTIGDFEHFCVLVRLSAAGDTDPANDVAQNNFFNVAEVAAQKIDFLIKNPKAAPAAAEILVDAAPRGWRFAIAGREGQNGRFTLQPKEVRKITLAVDPGEATGQKDGVPAAARGNVALRLDGEIVGGISFLIGEKESPPLSFFPPAGGVLAPYLIGTWDLRRQWTVLQIVNPTGRPLRLLAAFFDADEKPLACVRDRLSPNDLLEIDTRRHVHAPFGVVKVVALDENGRPVPGVVGIQREFGRTWLCGPRLRAETALHAIPAQALAGDMDMIRKACP